jgi:DNA-binding IclR family transcriptional regulator
LATATSKILRCIESLGRAASGLTVSEVAASAGISWQAANRLLEGLLTDSLVIRDGASKKYRLSLRLCEWSSLVIQASSPINFARKEIVKLAMETGRRCNLLVLEELDAVTVERFELVDGVPTNRFVPARRIWHESAAGRAIVAFSSECLRTDVLDRTLKRNGSAPLDRERLESELAEVREQGYAISPVVSRTGSRGIVVPVKDRTGYAVAAIGTVLPPTGLEDEARDRLICQVMACAATVSHYLGYEEQVSSEVDC